QDGPRRREGAGPRRGTRGAAEARGLPAALGKLVRVGGRVVRPGDARALRRRRRACARGRARTRTRHEIAPAAHIHQEPGDTTMLDSLIRLRTAMAVAALAL